MIRKSIVVKNESGLHARPAVKFVSTAKQFKSRLSVKVGDKTFNGRSIASILSAGVTVGTTIALEFDGEDENDAMEFLTAAIEAGLGE